MQRKEPELSPLARQLLGSSGAMKLFTQTEFDDALTVAKAEIMAIAIETTRKAIEIEREECAKVAENISSYDRDEPETSIAKAIRARMKK